MKSLNLLKIYEENFSVKVLIKFILFILIVSSSFTVFFILQQRRTLTTNLIEKGELFAKLLADNSKLGVFTENKDLLINSMEGFLQQDEVMSLSIFTLEGKLLLRQEKREAKTQGKNMEVDQNKLKLILEKVKKSRSAFYLESTTGTFEFWAPVTSGSKYFVNEGLFFDNNSSRTKEHIIGFVGFTLDKGILNRQLKDILYKGILIGIIFLIIGSAVAYPIAKGITKPLNKLTESVKALGMGGSVEKLPVETKDEIGRLALAFDNMVIELKQAEEELIGSRDQLRSLTARLAEVEEAERKRLTQILHDEVLQNLTVIGINLKALQSYLPKKIEDLVGLQIDDSVSLLEQTSNYLRDVMTELRPSVLDDLGLLAALRSYSKQISERTDVDVKVQGEEMMPRLPLVKETALFRIGQEALTNIVKHAQANQVTVTLKEKAEMVQFTIADNGKGFDNSSIRMIEQRGWGLMTMKERATAVGWHLRVESKQGKGTQIVVEGKR
jgi:signal transduction histidine kinase